MTSGFSHWKVPVMVPYIMRYYYVTPYIILLHKSDTHKIIVALREDAFFVFLKA